MATLNGGNLWLSPVERATLGALLYSYVGGSGPVAETLGNIGEALGESHCMWPFIDKDEPKLDVTGCHVALTPGYPFE